MAVRPPVPIALTPAERRLANQIDFDPTELRLGGSFHEALKRSCAAAKDLTVSLIARDAIPSIRRAYFTDPRYHVGSKSSRLQVFEDNGTRGEDIFEHGNFLAYLRYFIFGPDLPAATIRGFCGLVDSDGHVLGTELNQLRRYARSETRSRRLDRLHASEEFYKLTLECGLVESIARSVRDAVRQVR